MTCHATFNNISVCLLFPKAQTKLHVSEAQPPLDLISVKAYLSWLPRDGSWIPRINKPGVLLKLNPGPKKP